MIEWILHFDTDFKVTIFANPIKKFQSKNIIKS